MTWGRVVVIALCITVAVAQPGLDAAITRLLADMSVEEKARQLVIDNGVSRCTTDGYFDSAKAADYLTNLRAGVFDELGRNVDVVLANSIQRAVINASRHGIGLIIAEECQHGVQGDWHTVFPSPYTIAAAFDRDLMIDIGTVIGTEARAGGCNQCWSPVCGLAREPRWGRAEEEMGEVPIKCSRS